MYEIHYLLIMGNGCPVEKQVTAGSSAEARELAYRIKKAGLELVMNPMCKGCQKFLNGCDGEINHIYSGCVYK